MGAYQGTSYLLKLGYSKIAYIGAPLSKGIGRGRLEGYKRALLEWGITPDEGLIIEGDLTEACGYNIIRDLWNRSSKPDAILAVNDIVAIGAILGARELGIRIPEELGVVGFDNIRESALVMPSLTTVAQPAYEIGRLACEMFIRRRDNPDLPVQSITLLPRLVIRDSTKSIKPEE
jgi:LacI family transcriptional regulator